MTLSFIDIHAKDNNKVKHLRGLCEQANYRKKQQQTVLEGVHLIEAYLKTGKPVNGFYLTRQALENMEVQQLLDQLSGLPVYVLTESLYQDIRTLGPVSLRCMFHGFMCPCVCALIVCALRAINDCAAAR